MQLSLLTFVSVTALSTACLAQPVPTLSPPYPELAVSYHPSWVKQGGLTNLRFTLTNAHPTFALSNVLVIDTLPGGMTVAQPNAATGTCGGSIVAVPGSSSVVLSNGTVPAAARCSFSVNVLAPTSPGIYTNTVVVSNGVGTQTVEASLKVNPPLELTKSFDSLNIGVGGRTGAYYQLANANSDLPLSGVRFTDVLPPGLRFTDVLSTPGCGGHWRVDATLTTLTFEGSLPGGWGCGIATFVVGIEPGLQNSVTSSVFTNETAPLPPASARIHVGAPFQVSYFPNLRRGDGVINATNPGSLGADRPAGSSASTTGAICLNVYAFAPDEQMVACCSCPVTPNGLVTLSAQRDIVSNAFTSTAPASIVVKLLASIPDNGSCQGSAAVAHEANLASSLNAWGTKIHELGAEAKVTETAFLPATLSAGELNRMTRLCSVISASDRGYGICGSCRLGAMGGGSLR